MTARFVPSEEPVRAVEALLRSLDPFLRSLAGQHATIANSARGTPGRSVELTRPDNITVSLTICPLMLEADAVAPSQFLVALHGWSESAGRRFHWRNGPEWTVSLKTASDTHAARAVIERAWKLALDLDAGALIRSDDAESITGED